MIQTNPNNNHLLTVPHKIPQQFASSIDHNPLRMYSVQETPVHSMNLLKLYPTEP